ncbi:hypothetical protein CLAIMM_03353 [Cladophialophora immunda]|nr:hypothetical protein CLAIMM_03353 [Cladophialophora immunda]
MRTRRRIRGRVRADGTTSPRRATAGTRTAADPDETMTAEGGRGRETPPTDGGSGVGLRRGRHHVNEIGTGTVTATGTGTRSGSGSVIEIAIETEGVEVGGTGTSMATAGERGAGVVTGIEIRKTTELNAHTDAHDHAHRPGTVVGMRCAHALLFDAVITIGPGLETGTSPTMKHQAPDPREKETTAQPDKPVTNGDAMAVDEDDEDALLRKMMGFTMFKSTQNTKVPGNQIYGVRKEKKTTYRQYMNRVGGFNRPLSPSR